MTRILTAGLLGAVVYYIWGMMTWMVIPLHMPTLNGLPNEEVVIEALTGLESGLYTAPFTLDEKDMSDPDSDFMKRHQAGPIFSIFLHKEGDAPMAPSMLVGGYVVAALASIIAALLLSTIGTCGSSYWCRVGFVAGLGVFTSVIGHISYWNWMYFPLDYTVAFVVDEVVGWTLAGLVIAYFVRPKQDSATTTPQASTPAATTSAPAQPKAAPPKEPTRNDAISLLATLQREARFIDIVKEPLGDYSDEQIGAAARDVLRDCGTALDRMFKLEPVVDQEEGATVEIPDGADAAQYRIAGNATGDTKSGSLVHHGWQAKQCELPQWTGAKDAALVVAPAELEVK